MFKLYVKTALRNLQRHKNSSLINIAGLMVGLAAFLLILLVVQYEQSFDNFHRAKDNIYRVVRTGRSEENREYRTGVPFPVTQGLRSDIPQLKKTAAVYHDNDVQVSTTPQDGSAVKRFKEKNILIAEPQFFEMFDFPMASGNISALKNVNTALLTKEAAKRYFGDWQQAPGKTIKIYGELMQVSGVLENPPANTDFPLNIVVSYATLMKFTDPNDWGSISDQNYCFVELNDNASVATFHQLVDQFTNKHIKPVNPGYFLSLQPLAEIHYDKRYGNFTGHVFSKDLIMALYIIGIFLLVIACINFINITTARAMNRAREVGVRKVLGSSKKQLMLQFLGETCVTTLFALAGSLLIVLLFIPFLNSLLGFHLTAASLLNQPFLLSLLISFFIVSFLSGFYPALVLSGFQPIHVLKSALVVNIKGISLRRVLVVFQFVIAQALIIGTLIVASQMDYFKNADMGFNKLGVINASFPTDSLSRTKIDMLKYEVSKIDGIKQVSLSVFTPAGGGDWATDLRTAGNNSKTNPNMIVQMKPADTAFFSLYDLKLVAGRAYFPSDTMREFVVNETVVRSLGIKDPEKAIGKNIQVAGKYGEIVGVVRDYHTFSLRDAIAPTVMTTLKNNYSVANIKIDMQKAQQVVAAMQAIWQQHFPNFVFEYQFLDQTLENYYQQENQMATLYKIFSAIAIFISCLGLYGLISFIAVQRKKEIGIRKVLGAPAGNIVVMLSKEFTILIGIAFIIATPAAWYFMHEWLQQYTYRITVGPGIFIATVIGSLMIAWFTVGYTTIKAAMANPVKSLRTE